MPTCIHTLYMITQPPRTPDDTYMQTYIHGFCTLQKLQPKPLKTPFLPAS